MCIWVPTHATKIGAPPRCERRSWFEPGGHDVSEKRGMLVYPLKDMPATVYAYHAGKLVPYDEATVPIDLPAVTEAFTVFALASSPEFVGEFWFGKGSEAVI